MGQIWPRVNIEGKYDSAAWAATNWIRIGVVGPSEILNGQRPALSFDAAN
jgi:hypothetical protein